MTDERPADRTTATDPELEDGVDPGAFIGREPELTRAEIPTTALPDRPAIPDPGWNPMPEGHREAINATDDEVKRKG